MIERTRRLLFLAATVAASLLITAVASAQCTLQLSDSGVLRLQSGEEHKVSWNLVPGATSYYTEDLIQSLGDPASPDFAFGAPYSESHNGESPNLTTYLLTHEVLYKTTFRFRVTAFNRNNASWQPCSASVTYVVDVDPRMASIAARRVIPLAGKAPAMNGGAYSTALIIAGTGIGCTHSSPCKDPNGNVVEAPKLYQGRIYFRPLGQNESDSDPSIPYALNGDETVVYNDIMQDLGATGLGTLEVIPKPGYPTPAVDAFIDSRPANAPQNSTRIPAAWGRDYLSPSNGGTIAIRSEADTRLAIGIRTWSADMNLVTIEHLNAAGESLGIQRVSAPFPSSTALFPLDSLFQNIHTGDRFNIGYANIQFSRADGLVSIGRGGAALLFVTETANHLNVPNLLYREPIGNTRYSQGFDYYVVY